MASAISEIPQIPNVEQRYIEGKGRCLFATQPFKKGETIFVEDPIIACQFAWNKSYDYSACDHCMKQIHYPPESMNIMLLAKLVATIHLAENREAMYNQFMQFCHISCDDKGASTSTLLGEKFQCDIDNMWHLFSSALHERCSNGQDDPVIKTVELIFLMLLTREGFIKMLSLVARNGQGIGTSILAQWANKVLSMNVCADDQTDYDSLIENIYQEIENHVGIFINNEGSGLYSMQSCINHSCAPNAKIAFPFNCSRLALVAKKDILPGEEIFITYLDKCSRKRSCHSRRKILQNHYLFECMCSKCLLDSTNEPDVTSDDDDDDDDMDEDM
ncbi:hypothetical protein V9T40_014287 [Parthenolecanium corni]|uniref:SET domain-containing protein n=1 Tax=Parthenolecanium corni TaxID=536013 RepID=A0AAN9XXD3_9HEMI